MLLATVFFALVYTVFSNFDTSTCGQSKGCFLPTDPECYQGCNGMKYSWLQLDKDLMQIELAVDSTDTSESFYVAVGFSEDDLMGDDSVIECSMLGNNPLSLKLSYNINSTTDPSTNGEPTNRRQFKTGSEFFLNSTITNTDGHAYCSAVLNVTAAAEAGLLRINFTQSYYFLMANGPTTDTGLLHHVHDVTSAKALKLSDIVSGFDMDPCGLQKGCFLPVTNSHTMTGLAVSYKVLNSSFITFELLAPAYGSVNFYVAVSFSTSFLFKNMSTIECSSLDDGKLSMKFSYNYDYWTNVRIPSEEAIRDQYFIDEVAVFQDGQVYCSAVVNVQGSSVSDKIFKYNPNQSYYLLLNSGMTSRNELLPPSESNESPLPSKLTQYEEYFDSSTCGIDKECFLPTECYRGCNGMGFSYKMINDTMMRIELFSIAPDNNQYVAVGFSDDDKMGDDYVIECSALVNQPYSLKFSYNDATPANVRIPGEETIRSQYILQSMVASSDVQLYCSAIVNVSGRSGNDQVIHLKPLQNYYLLLASGYTGANGLTEHKHTCVSSPRPIIDPGNQNSNSFDNSTCGKTKGCFISNGLSASYEVLTTKQIRFELSMPTKQTSSVYLALGFSNDDKMGQDNVIECSALTSAQLSMKFSYNPTTRNIRIPGEETIRSTYFQNETATFTDGMMYCSAVVTVSGWTNNSEVFTYDPNKEYYLFLATGQATASGLTQHTGKAISTPRQLSDYSTDASGTSGLSPNVKQRLIKAHAILMIISWFFFVPTAVMFARFLRASWPTVKPCGLLIWFHVHRTSNLIGIACNVASFICILTANNWEWTGPGSQSSKWGKTHSMIGVFALCLAWIQPFVSAMRCNPGHPRRPYFNWVHRFIGVIAMILATTAICIAADHFLSIWPHRLLQLTLSLLPIVLLIVLSIVFTPLDKLIEVNERNFQKINRVRVLLVAIGVLGMASITVTLSVFVGIGA
nr:DOMON domain containing protein [Haemonchus contortus]